MVVTQILFEQRQRYVLFIAIEHAFNLFDFKSK